MSATRERDMVVFKGAKIDGSQVKNQRKTKKGQVSVDGFLSGPLKGAPEKAASKFLDANSELFGGETETRPELQVEQVQRSPAGYHVTFKQMHQGVPVEEAKLSVHMTRDKRVNAAQGRLIPEVASLDVKKMAENGIEQDEAIKIAQSAVTKRKSPLPAQAEQVILAEETPRLTWKVTLATKRPAAEWAVWVDVQSGDVLQQRELSMEKG